eukprot:2926853-Alexandrium_andersonii.AAC.1
MSASLVGSEMCIRDRFKRGGPLHFAGWSSTMFLGGFRQAPLDASMVSHGPPNWSQTLPRGAFCSIARRDSEYWQPPTYMFSPCRTHPWPSCGTGPAAGSRNPPSSRTGRWRPGTCSRRPGRCRTAPSCPTSA